MLWVTMSAVRGIPPLRKHTSTLSSCMMSRWPFGPWLRTSLSAMFEFARTTQPRLHISQEHGYFLSAVHIQGKTNCLPDLLSRPDSIIQSEWTLVLHALFLVWDKFREPAHRPVYIQVQCETADIHVFRPGHLDLGGRHNGAGLVEDGGYASPPLPLIQVVLSK